MIPTTESQSDYDGFLSTTTEWHMAIVGLAIGLFFGKSKTLRHEARKEPQYLVGCALVGWIVGFVSDEYL